MDKPSSGASAARSSFSLSQQDINIKADDLAKPLGKGGFGVVYKGTLQLAPAAIKELLVPNLSARELKEFTKEAEIMAELRHANIIQLYGFTETAPYRIVMELMPKGSLYHVLRDVEDLSWIQKIRWGMEIGAGLHYLHTRTPQIIHRDLKSLNVLISKDNTAKLTDFGLALAKLRTTTSTLSSSSKAKKAEEPTGAVGSTRWMAPELFSLKPKYSAASDLFAYAMVLWELASREIPYAEVGDDSIIKDSIKCGERADIPDDCPRVLATLIQVCWDQKPEQRLTAEKAVETLRAALPAFEVEEAQQALATASLKQKQSVAAASSGYAVTTLAPTESRGYALESEKSAAAKPSVPPRPTKSVAAEPKPAAFFAPKAPAKPIVDQAAVEKLLLHVARGEQEQAEALLKVKGNEVLLFKGKVTDYSHRTFENITAFQYALWALDWHMWKMILKYLPKEEAAHQLQDLKTNSTEHGTHYDFTPLIQALQTFIDKYKKWHKANNYDAIKNQWTKGVGGAQTQVPAHVANEYCRPGRSFEPTPSFKEDNLPRNFFLSNIDKFFPLGRYPSGSLSIDFAFSVWYGPPRLTNMWKDGTTDISYFRAWATVLSADMKAIIGLRKVRTEQLAELTCELPPVPLAAFFAPKAPAKPVIDQAAVENLLLHVAHGEQDEAEALLKIKGNEALLLQKGKVTDYSNRTFGNITALQYALWALDWHMWKMLLKYIPKDKAAQQLQDLEAHGTEHRQHFDFTPLIQALKTCVDNNDAWRKTNNFDAMRDHWIKGVGGAQTQVPAHIAHEYCRPDRSFEPTPSFKEDNLPRSLDIDSGSKFFPLSDRYSSFALTRLCYGPWRYDSSSVCSDLSSHLAAITGLCKVRTEQFAELSREVASAPARRPGLSK